MATGHDGQVALSASAFQKRFCCVPAKSVFLIHFKVSTPFIVTPVKVRDSGYTRLGCCITKSIKNLPTQALFLNAPFTTGAMKFIRTAMMIFGFQENW